MLDELLKQIESDLKANRLIPTEKWINRGGELEMYLEGERVKLAEIKIRNAQEKESIKVELAKEGVKVTDVAAENRLILRPSWLEEEKQTARIKKIEGYIETAKSHSYHMR